LDICSLRWKKIRSGIYALFLIEMAKFNFCVTIKPSARACLYQCQYELGAPNSHCHYGTRYKETRLGRTLNISKRRVVACQKTRVRAGSKHTTHRMQTSLIYVRPDLCVGGEIEIHKWRIYWNVSRTFPNAESEYSRA
jgi:hypothetical protein